MFRCTSLTLSISFILFFCCALIVKAQTPTLIPDAPSLDRDMNLVFNGSFEELHLTGGFESIFTPSVDGDGVYYIIDISDREPYAIPEGWTTSGGGSMTYASWGNNIINTFVGNTVMGQAQSDPNINGERTVYMGNSFVESILEVPEFLPTGEVVFNSEPTIVTRPGFDEPVRITQNLTGLIPDGTYRMSFWVSGENSVDINFPITRHEGFFGFELEGYDTMYLVIPPGVALEPPGFPHIFGDDTSHVYTVEFEAVDTDMELTFINWGHFVNENSLPQFRTIGWSLSSTPEVILDDVIINIISAPRNVPTLSEWGLIIMAVMFGMLSLFVIRKRQRSIS